MVVIQLGPKPRQQAVPTVVPSWFSQGQVDQEGQRPAAADLDRIEADPLRQPRQVGLDAEQACQVRGNRNALQVLLRNLVDNALRYTPAGGDVTVVIRMQPQGCCLRVVDDGPGIPPRARRRRSGAGARAPLCR